MPILSTSTSPRWIQKDAFSINEQEAKDQDIRPLRIGLVNYMPDAAFIDTEQFFITPIIEAAGVLQFEIILFAPESIPRSAETQAYISAHYEPISDKRLRECDILIQTGTNEVHSDGSSFDFKNGKEAQEIINVFKRAKSLGVNTQVGSCFASQVIAHNEYSVSVKRIQHPGKNSPKKLLGVFPHKVAKNRGISAHNAEENFITRNLNSEFNAVFGRNHTLSTEEILHHESLEPLIVSSEKIGGKNGQHETHLFYDPRELFFGFQGHPEYQQFNILKEYLRDVGFYYRDPKNLVFPEIPPNYFTSAGKKQMQEFTDAVKEQAEKRHLFQQEISKNSGNEAGKKQKILESLQNFDRENRPRIDDSIYDEVIQSWKDTGDKVWARIFNATYQLTGFEPGQKLTKKRDISIQEFPLEALV